jgi:hypothetical protein
MDNLAIANQANAHQKFWQAVIDTAIADWVRGPGSYKRSAEYFLFQDEEDFPFVCRSAGLEPKCVRESLWAIRAQAVVGTSKDAA